MAKAIWQDIVLAESDSIQKVEGNIYFPPESINKTYFEKSETETISSTLGTAVYYHLNVNGHVNVDAAWYYPHPKKGADNIKNYVAFWRGVEVFE